MNLNEWRPHKKQAEFLAIPFSVREAFYGGGAGSAKTETLLSYGICHKLHENPKFKQVFMRRTFPELKKEVIPRSRDIYTKFGATLNLSDMVWTFPRLDQYGGTGIGNRGANIFFAHCENEDDVHAYDSMEISLFTPDELTSFTQWMYLYIAFTRVRAPKGSGLPSIIRAAGMPGDIGHTWVKKRFVDPAPLGGKIIRGKGDNKRIYIHATLADNPHIDPTYAQSLEALPEAEKQAKKFGSWDAYLGQVFEEFRDKKYEDEPENALHVIEPFEIPTWWPKIVVMDWGHAAMTWVGYGAISPTKRLYVYREQHWKKVKIAEWVPFVKEFVDKEDPAIIKMCRSAGQDRGEEHTILQQVTEALGHRVYLTTNAAGSRISGKMLLHEYLRWKQKHKVRKENVPYDDVHAQWLLRNRGMKGYSDYLKSFEPQVDEDNLPKLQIFNTCPTLINSIKSCSFDKNNPEDVAAFDGDDPYDSIRYMVDAVDHYTQTAIEEMKKIKAQQELQEEFAKTQDWNLLYRKAKILESRNRNVAVVRYRHRSRMH